MTASKGDPTVPSGGVPKLRCYHCGKPIAHTQVAAGAIKGAGPQVVWCFTCWDAPDGIAVVEYRNYL